MTDELPAILIALGLAYLIYRTCFKAAPVDPNDPLARGPLRGVTSEMISTVSAAFPHIPPPHIVYSLSKTRSAQATSEIILERGSLPAPPPDFPVHPFLAAPVPAAVPATSHTPTTGSSASSSSSSSASASKSAPSLIERYGLASRIRTQDPSLPTDAAGSGQDDAKAGASATAPGLGDKGWAQTADERERALKERKERMVLEARRRMLAKQSVQKKD